MKTNLVTYKIKYSTNADLTNIIKSYNNVLRFTYNRLLENPKYTTRELTSLQKTLNNVSLIDSHLKNSAIYDAKSLIEKSTEPIIFGGKKNFILRCQHKITHEEFKYNRLRPLNCVGEANKKANRHFQIIDKDTILFKLNKNNHFELNLHFVGKKRTKELIQLINLQNNCVCPITYKLDLEYVYLTFDYNVLKNYTYKIKENRVFAIDINPNGIGYSIVDWLDECHYNIIDKGIFSISPLNDKHYNEHLNSIDAKYFVNKRKHEIIHIAKQLFNLCKHYKCEVFSVEKLNIKSSDKGVGKRFNRMCNNIWNRGLLIQQIKKYINASSTIFIEVQPQWSSVIGNILYRKEKLPDEILASIEIGRRGFEFVTQYISNRRPHKKTVVFPDRKLVKNQLILSLEELDIDVPNFDNWTTICSLVKKSKKKYRFSKSDIKSDSLFSKFYKQKLIEVYTFT